MDVILKSLKAQPQVQAAWEGGSAATGTADEYSDIDLCLLSPGPLRPVLDAVEKSLAEFGVTHTWQAAKSFWGEGLMQRVIVLKGSPKYFFVDVGVFDTAHPQLLRDFLEVERHGQPVIHFDRSGAVKPGHTDAAALFARQQVRAEELAAGFVIFKTLVLKELARGQVIDAFSFYQTGLVRPLAEVMGMLHRPFKFDFGLRYLHRHFPAEAREQIQELCYVSSPDELAGRAEQADRMLQEALAQVRARTGLELPE